MLWIERQIFLQLQRFLKLEVSAIAIFREDWKNANSQNPKEIHTDALRTYREGVSQYFSNINTAEVATDE
jgi:hypothetical protein